jgi:hypothetical protein
VCGVDGEWTVERHLLGKPPEVIALYYRFIELAQACGPFTYAISKTAITLKGTRRGFAGAVLGERALRGYLDLQRRVEDARITRSGLTPSACMSTTSASIASASWTSGSLSGSVRHTRWVSAPIWPIP